MILHKCKTCNEERFENHFRNGITSLGEHFVSLKRCKVCLGITVVDRENEFYEVDFNKMMLLLTNLHFNNGGITTMQCLDLTEIYKSLYGEKMPPFKTNKDKLTYQWNRLIAFWNRNNEFKF